MASRTPFGCWSSYWHSFQCMKLSPIHNTFTAKHKSTSNFTYPMIKLMWDRWHIHDLPADPDFIHLGRNMTYTTHCSWYKNHISDFIEDCKIIRILVAWTIGWEMCCLPQRIRLNCLWQDMQTNDKLLYSEHDSFDRLFSHEWTSSACGRTITIDTWPELTNINRTNTDRDV